MTDNGEKTDSTENFPQSFRGAVLSAARRELTILSNADTIRAKRAGQLRSVCVGDLVEYEFRSGEAYAFKLFERANCVRRSSKGEEQTLAANLNILCIITAATNQFSPLFIDRVLCLASSEHIPAILVINKSDLDNTLADQIYDTYSSIGVKCLTCSALNHELTELKYQLTELADSTAALVGVSGVGKSTILNKLVPGVGRYTQEVSRKTGQGKQTTSLARGFCIQRPGRSSLVLIDLPGIQSFGLSHLLDQNIGDFFVEFREYAQNCKFRDCKHMLEDSCGVKSALANRQIHTSRYQSYLHITNELEEAKKYQYTKR